MRKKTYRWVAAVAILLGTSLFFLRYAAKENNDEEAIDDHRGIVKWYSGVQFYGKP